MCWRMSAAETSAARLAAGGAEGAGAGEAGGVEMARALRAASWFQSAMKICEDLSAVRLDVHESLRPSGEKEGRPSKPSEVVTRMGSCWPAASTM